MKNIKLSDFSKAKVLVTGDVMLDRYWHGTTKRISPEAPVPVVSIHEHDYRPGGASNVAANIAALGAEPSLLGLCGDDEYAERLKLLLFKHNVKHHLLKLSDYPTTSKLRILCQGQQLIRLDREESYAELDKKEYLNKFRQLLVDNNVLVLSDYAKGTLSEVKQMLNLANELGIPSIVDPKLTDYSMYDNATIITPNLKEFQQIVGVCYSDSDIVKRGRNLIKQHNFSYLIITRGKDGLTVIPRDSKEQNFAAHSSDVFDVTGAGDTVVAVIAACLANNINIFDAANLATVAAGIVVGRVGASYVTKYELQSAIVSGINQTSKNLNKSQVLQQIKFHKTQGESIVFTNGCYDILHHGHIKYLERAKALGDILVVGINDDEYIARTKGKGRPVNGLSERMEVLLGLKAVDYVLPFSESAPGKLVSELVPDIMVKTDEHFSSIADMPADEGAEVVVANGGKVVFFSRTPNCSSTKILESV